MNNNNLAYRLGLDVGSTTAKIVVIDQNDSVVHTEYERHNTQIHKTVNQLFDKVKKHIGNSKISICVTGSAGIGLSEKMGIPFVQEVVATTEVVKNLYPYVKTLIDIGGEDSKMIFFNPSKPPDIRMNGNCAGGTGAFIDQMASLMNVSSTDLNQLTSKSKHIYSIASRCGVFAKTDVQNLISRKVPKEDVAASVFHAVSIQAMNTLARGYDVKPKIMFIGGPFTFLPQLMETFKNDLHIDSLDVIYADHPALLPAMGAAFHNDSKPLIISIEDLQLIIEKSDNQNLTVSNRLTPLFHSKDDFQKWNENRLLVKVPVVEMSEYIENECFIGIDSGSTTTKIVAIGNSGELLYRYYSNNNANPVETVRQGLQLFDEEQKKQNRKFDIKHCGVTGYGEDLIRSAFGIDLGIVETIAHFSAAKNFCPDVSFILDIGGQDMKAIFVQNGVVTRLELNESCSSGCGSFIETFGKNLGHKVSDFAALACQSHAPADLGTRCTVFMNSKVKQSLRENASIDDIAAGLSISVIKNALYKVLKLKTLQELGNHIVVQGGTFKNASVLRAFEQMLGKQVICTDIPELMGAYGAAIAAKNMLKSETDESKIMLNGQNYTDKQLLCKGCVNNCLITKFLFDNDSFYYSGNKCEKVFSNRGAKVEKGFSMFDFKNELLFNRIASETAIENRKKLKVVPRIGIPRVLNMFQNYPFWHTLLTECGLDVVLSAKSSTKIYEKGAGTVMSDSICFPAKLVHGHIYELAEQKVDRIFYPIIIYERNDFSNTQNSFNCPIVSSYADVVRSAINPEARWKIALDAPTFTLDNDKLLYKSGYEYVKQFGVKKSVFEQSFAKAKLEIQKFINTINTKALEIIEKAKLDNRMLIVLAGRPYHTDPMIHQKTPDILTELGADVLSEDVIPCNSDASLNDLQILSQWLFPNRIYNAAQWCSNQSDMVQFVQLNSFGCGPDSIAIDESFEILKEKNKNHTLIRVDEITSTGSVRLRLRSLIESLQLSRKANAKPKENVNRLNTATYTENDRHRILLAPYFSDIYSPFLPALFQLGGYKLVNLPKPSKDSVEFGLKYANNEICYPATVIVGDIIKSLLSDDYNHSEIAVAITQTGGQCRASTYLSLIKKAMVSAGITDVPVISINPDGAKLNPQPGFVVNWEKLLKPLFITIIYADSLAKLYYATVVREKEKGVSSSLFEKYQKLAEPFIVQKNIGKIYELLQLAVNEFNAIEIKDGEFPKIGFVGEIYVKFNTFGHLYISEWLIEQGIEVCMPPVLEFFTQSFVNITANKAGNLETFKLSDIYVRFLEETANFHIRKANRILSKSKIVEPFHNIRHAADKAKRILSLVNQFGEGWLIPAEVATFAESGVNNVVSVQPFGCIANHVISKGVEKRIRDLYPKVNMLFLDFDDGTTEVNILNRLHFMVKNVKEN